MPFGLKYHPDVKKVDLPLIDERMRQRIRKAIEDRLATAPHRYGIPLRRTLKGYWKLRGGDYRVVFKIVQGEVLILGIMHRQRIYQDIEKRV